VRRDRTGLPKTYRSISLRAIRGASSRHVAPLHRFHHFTEHSTPVQTSFRWLLGQADYSTLSPTLTNPALDPSVAPFRGLDREHVSIAIRNGLPFRGGCGM